MQPMRKHLLVLLDATFLTELAEKARQVTQLNVWPAVATYRCSKGAASVVNRQSGPIWKRKDVARAAKPKLASASSKPELLQAIRTRPYVRLATTWSWPLD